MSQNHGETQPALPGLDLKIPDGGNMHAMVQKQITTLEKLGYIEDHHAGQVALALTCARDLDNSFGRGAPSGRANLLRVMNEILETLPHPEAASKSKLDEVVEALMNSTEDEVSVASVRPTA